jgi:hypothetical protein
VADTAGGETMAPNRTASERQVKFTHEVIGLQGISSDQQVYLLFYRRGDGGLPLRKDVAVVCALLMSISFCETKIFRRACYLPLFL